MRVLNRLARFNEEQLPAQAGEAMNLSSFGSSEMFVIFLATGFGVLSVLVGLFWKAKILKLSAGTASM